MELFSGYEIDGIELGNRLVRSATGEGAAETDTGRPLAAMAEFYRRLASGGVGLIVSGHVAVSREGRCGNRMTAFYTDEFVPDFRRLVEACHAGGAPIVCQLNHGGRQVNASHEGIRSVCPSRARFEGASFTPEVLTRAEIERIIADFAAAAGRCREAGFDGVQIHSAHGYLVSEFNSPLINTREDDWGGDAARRQRFLAEVYGAIRAAVGEDYPILVKQNVSDFHPGGLVLSDAVAICSMLDSLGIAAIELSGGIAETIPVAFQAKTLRERGEVVFFEEECRAIRDAVRCPLILTGGIRTLATSERLVGEGGCDAVGLCRPLIREPDLPERWASGESDRATCVSCGGCKQSPARCNFCGLEGDGEAS